MNLKKISLKIFFLASFSNAAAMQSTDEVSTEMSVSINDLCEHLKTLKKISKHNPESLESIDATIYFTVETFKIFKKSDELIAIQILPSVRKAFLDATIQKFRIIENRSFDQQIDFAEYIEDILEQWQTNYKESHINLIKRRINSIKKQQRAIEHRAQQYPAVFFDQLITFENRNHAPQGLWSSSSMSADSTKMSIDYLLNN